MYDWVGKTNPRDFKRKKAKLLMTVTYSKNLGGTKPVFFLLNTKEKE